MGMLTELLVSLAGIVLILGLAFLMSNDKRRISVGAVIKLLVLQFVVAFILLKTSIGLKIVGVMADGIAKAMSYAHDGIEFVVGDLTDSGIFFVDTLMVIIFTTALLYALTYLKVIPIIVRYIGGALSRITGLPQVESFNGANSAFFGQTEAIIAVQGYLDNLSKNRLFIVSLSAMGSVSASIAGPYMEMLNPTYVLIAMILNVFSPLVIGAIMAPPEEGEGEGEMIETDELRKTAGDSFFGSLANGGSTGVNIAITIGAMLVVFIGLIAMVNAVFNGIFGITFQEIMGYVFSPFAFLMGVPASDILEVGNLMGTKILTNEFVAMGNYVDVAAGLTEKAKAIISVYMVSFAAVGSIGMVGGTYQAVKPGKAKQFYKFALPLLAGATLASMLSGTVIGIMTLI